MAYAAPTVASDPGSKAHIDAALATVTGFINTEQARTASVIVQCVSALEKCLTCLGAAPPYNVTYVTTRDTIQAVINTLGAL